MANRIRPSTDWYRRKVLSMEDGDYLIGPAFDPEIEAQPHEDSANPVLAFGSLLRLERRGRQLTVAELARAIDVDEAEIRSIEHDPNYRARPRTILSIAEHFDLPPKTVMKLAGAAASNDDGFVEKAMRFAAHSDDLGSLTKEEKQLLKKFVEYLRENS
ncbi:helix-turn-helix domain-containing protein [Paraburkholderia sp. SEWSISQ10-3 4]|uniref:helix-turn-helix domain-containing protein n=1 Tax=Paraburkholderia TaxID=1822464 RepID=UPI0022522C33|nr:MULTISPECIES: helix-turn-helix transcriptional regulator [Paraburkholderia]MCX4141118.1 helix-turn-helix transcriptional regulator [Paraburkholderia aspalathi]MDN7173801.1 helix-turn-helix domain-containing protein [Paraburkholderia sp. SEWSISQ10-3 4]MDQ6503442.1 helix-turn-helix domain-containing protein [Paraburkholderia aspalathi]